MIKPDQGKELQGALNIGIGGEFIYADGLLRTSVSAGPSILVTPGSLDNKGSMGGYFDLKPIGIRWPIFNQFILGIDPISLSILAPVLEGIPLVELEYRTTFIGEFLF